MTWRTLVAAPVLRATRPIRTEVRQQRAQMSNARTRRKIESDVSNGYVAVDFCNEVGIGARLVWCLNVLAYCDTNKSEADFRFSFPRAQDTDFFAPFFFIRNPNRSPAPRQFVRAVTIDAVPHEVIDLSRATDLARKYVAPQLDVSAETDQFWSEHGLDGNVLGVHYRGTDKTDEAPRVDYETVTRYVQSYLYRHRETTAIFVSSDERKFIDFAIATFADLPVVCREDFRRADTLQPVYRNLDDVPSIQRDAVVNCLLLARCSGLIKTASFLSAFAAILNPDMRTFIINRPHEKSLWFPEREMLALQEPL